MMTELIEMKDGVLVQVQTEEGRVSAAGGKAEPRKVETKYEEVAELIRRACGPVANSLREMRDAIKLKEAEIEFFCGVGAKGKFFLAESSINGHIKVTMKISL